MKTFTSFYWLGSETERTVIQATTTREAIAFHYECGWNAYDDRRLVAGDVALEAAHNHPEIVANESWGEDQ